MFAGAVDLSRLTAFLFSSKKECRLKLRLLQAAKVLSASIDAIAGLRDAGKQRLDINGIEYVGLAAEFAFDLNAALFCNDLKGFLFTQISHHGLNALLRTPAGEFGLKLFEHSGIVFPEQTAGYFSGFKRKQFLGLYSADKCREMLESFRIDFALLVAAG